MGKELTLDFADGHARSSANEGGERLAVRSLQNTSLALGDVVRLERELEVILLFQDVEAFGGPSLHVSYLQRRLGQVGTYRSARMSCWVTERPAGASAGGLVASESELSGAVAVSTAGPSRRLWTWGAARTDEV